MPVPRTVPLTLRLGESRYNLVPPRDIATWELYKQHESCIWTAEEVDLESDDFDRLTEGERHYIRKVLTFFAFADGIVNENLAMNFVNEVDLPEAKAFYVFQSMMENIHAETYGLLIQKYFPKSDAAEILTELERDGALRCKADWMQRWITSRNSFAERLVAFACVEGIHFSSAFCSIFWLKKRGLPMNGLIFSNELISRDEGLHCKFAVHMHAKLLSSEQLSPSEADRWLAPFGFAEAQAPIVMTDEARIRASLSCAYPTATATALDHAATELLASRRCTPDTIRDIVRSACEVEFAFLTTDALPVDLIGMNAKLAVEYVKHVANVLTLSLGIGEVYEHVANPFDWMELISLPGKTNFFERRVSEYQKAGIMSRLQGHVREFDTGSDF